jgi:hypothetical protein
MPKGTVRGVGATRKNGHVAVRTDEFAGHAEQGRRSTGSPSSSSSRTGRNRSNASGAMNGYRVRWLWTGLRPVPTTISTRPWKRPGTPEVARRATLHNSRPARMYGDGPEDGVVVDDRNR